MVYDQSIRGHNTYLLDVTVDQLLKFWVPEKCICNEWNIRLPRQCPLIWFSSNFWTSFVCMLYVDKVTNECSNLLGYLGHV